MSRFDPFFAVTGPALFTGGASGVAFAFPLCGGDETGEIPGRVLSGGGGTCGETCVVAKPGGALDFGGTLGSVLRPGGGGGLLGDGELAGGSPLADGLVEGGEGRGSGEDEDPGGGGLGIPTSVFFASVIGAIDPGIDGGGGGAAGDRSAVFFPRPSKISRSEPPLLSSDIRVS